MQQQTVKNKAASVKKTDKHFVTRGKKQTQVSAIAGNVNGELIPIIEQDMVHFYMRDYSIPKDSDPMYRKEFERKKKVMTKQEFLMCFQSNYINNFRNIDSPSQLYRILLNMNAEVIEKYYYSEIPQKMQGLERRDYIELRMLPKKSRMSLNGGNLYVLKEDFIHVPDLESKSLPENI